MALAQVRIDQARRAVEASERQWRRALADQRRGQLRRITGIEPHEEQRRDDRKGRER